MTCHRDGWTFAAVLTALVAGFLGESLLLGRVLSPADVLRVSASFRDARRPSFEPVNRLLIDPVLQFQPWLEFNRAMIRRGRLPLWNGRAGCGAPHLANGQSAVFDPFHAIAYLGTLPEAYAWMAAARLWVAGMGMFLLARSWGLDPGDAGSQAWSSRSAASWSSGCSSRSRAWRSGCPGCSGPPTGPCNTPSHGRSDCSPWPWGSSCSAGTSRRAPTCCWRRGSTQPGGSGPEPPRNSSLVPPQQTSRARGSRSALPTKSWAGHPGTWHQRTPETAPNLRGCRNRSPDGAWRPGSGASC